MHNVNSGILFDSWKPQTKCKLIYHRNEFCNPIIDFSLTVEGADRYEDSLLMEYSKNMDISVKYKCTKETFKACEENAERTILRLLMEPITDRIEHLISLITNSEQMASLDLANEIYDICKNGQRAIKNCDLTDNIGTMPNI